MVIKIDKGVLKEVIESYNNIKRSDYNLRNIISHQLKKISEQYKAMCDCECCIHAKSMHSYLLT